MGVKVGVGDGVRVIVAVKTGVLVGGGVLLGTGELVAVGVLVGVRVGVYVGVLVGVRVGVKVAVGPTTIIVPKTTPLLYEEPTEGQPNENGQSSRR